MKFFLSSTAYDLYDFRALVVDELRKLGHEVLHHEMPTFSSLAPLHSHDACLRAVEACDVVIGLLDRRYGGKYHGKLEQPYVMDLDDFYIHAGNKRIPSKVKGSELSITWCEFRAARHFKKPMITFARKRLMDEKAVRRKNQVFADFEPAYADNNRLFDLLEWLTQQETFNWISPFDSIVDFREQLVTWVKKLEEELATEQVHDRDDAVRMAKLPHILVIVEGRKDRHFVKYLISKLEIQCVFAVTVASGKENAIKEWKTQATVQGTLFDRVILLVDSDEDAAQALIEQRERLQSIMLETGEPRLMYSMATPEIEAWLVAGLQNAEVLGEDAKSQLRHVRSMHSRQWEELLHNQYDLNRARETNDDLNQFCELLLGSTSVD